ncbi:MAG: twin-arginine translocase subunit TatB [Alphaproteobacteria bacterium]|nr:twin-arginine translocase subunit TatB [Alphaproteobacteria bacterium]
MLPQLGFTEILLLSVLALVVIGPKDLPLMARKIGRWIARMRGLAAEFRAGFDELARQAELDELKREVQALRNDQTLRDLDREIRTPLPHTPATTPGASPALSPPPAGDPPENAETPASNDASDAPADPAAPPAKATSGGA